MQQDPMRSYRAKRDALRPSVLTKYGILGFLASGTYGRVYKARVKENGAEGEVVAIKKFKPEKEGEVVAYTGISQSACREIMLNRELLHVNLAALKEVMLEDKSIYMIFEFAEHDFLQIIHHHSTSRTTIALPVLKSLLYQLLNGISYLHDNWVIHRDLKPANILVTDKGVVKIGDLGLARIYAAPLQSLYTSDKVVVTIWYRPPDLLLGARHYTASVDLWSTGCIFGELIALRPMFKGEEAKMEAPTVTTTGGTKKSSVPFQRDQLLRVFEILGTPNTKAWPAITQLPEYPRMVEFGNYVNDLHKWFSARAPRGASQSGFELISSLLTYDCSKRISAREALKHKWWSEEPKVQDASFPMNTYPARRVSMDDSDAQLRAAAALEAKSTKTHAAPGSAPGSGRPAKRSRME